MIERSFGIILYLISPPAGVMGVWSLSLRLDRKYIGRSGAHKYPDFDANFLDYGNSSFLSSDH